MANTFGKLFTLTSFGESHGPAIGGIVDGCPPGLELSESDIQIALDKRKPGNSSFTSQRREPDEIQILSGVFKGKTTGAPIGLLIHNVNQRSSDYADLKDVLRPGHGDYTYHKKYGVRDYQGGGRASARETAVRVGAGAIAQKYLNEKGIQIQAYLAQMGDIQYDPQHFSWDEINKNDFFFPDYTKIEALSMLIETLRREGDSIGARVNIQATGLPAGLGEPIFGKLNADLAHGLMSIPAVKGVEIGDGFNVVSQKGSYHRDQMTPSGFLSNHAGGILAGISTGQTINASIAFKPPSSIRIPASAVDESNDAVEVVVKGRHDPCVGIRAVAVAQAMMALVIMDHWLCRYGQIQ